MNLPVILSRGCFLAVVTVSPSLIISIGYEVIAFATFGKCFIILAVLLLAWHCYSTSINSRAVLLPFFVLHPAQANRMFQSSWSFFPGGQKSGRERGILCSTWTPS